MAAAKSAGVAVWRKVSRLVWLGKRQRQAGPSVIGWARM